MVTAKFKVSNVNDYGNYRQVFLLPVYSSNKSSPNYSWSQATPSGKMEMTITNPGAYEQFAVGKTFLMKFEEVTE
jgi:hypothetical protein